MKLLVSGVIIISFFVILIIYICNNIINNNSKGKVFNSFTDVPYNKVGLLLGTSKYLNFGPVNPYYQNRIDAALKLLNSGKIKYIIVSGDNHKNNYNEPEQMRADLINEGIDSSVIYMDFAGFRTYDSMIRLQKIFSENKVTVISQKFHNQRAIYIADKLGIDAVGYNAKDVNAKMDYHVKVREKFARVKVFFDFIFGTKPKFLGKTITIPA